MASSTPSKKIACSECKATSLLPAVHDLPKTVQLEHCMIKSAVSKFVLADWALRSKDPPGRDTDLNACHQFAPTPALEFLYSESWKRFYPSTLEENYFFAIWAAGDARYLVFQHDCESAMDLKCDTTMSVVEFLDALEPCVRSSFWYDATKKGKKVQKHLPMSATPTHTCPRTPISMVLSTPSKNEACIECEATGVLPAVHDLPKTVQLEHRITDLESEEHRTIFADWAMRASPEYERRLRNGMDTLARDKDLAACHHLLHGFAPTPALEFLYSEAFEQRFYPSESESGAVALNYHFAIWAAGGVRYLVYEGGVDDQCQALETKCDTAMSAGEFLNALERCLRHSFWYAKKNKYPTLIMGVARGLR
ncbi:hypothetical protein B0H15DRAFT_991237 [Mycena belliarum]|uniref:Uncharacterized protein n=1 Tax=Mycena belliarum TaxID=1033014 RepID=A0AAD6Y0P1_9AGAR|nr:hypothetical protein B0H15DRAFT_991237 [Mycena belliae]